MAARNTGETLLLTGTALGTAGAVAADCLTTGGALTAGVVLTKGFEFVAGLGQGEVAERIKARFGSARDLADVHRNHHLEAVLRRAIADVIEQTAEARGGDAGLAFVAQTGRLRIEDAPSLVTDLFAQTAAAGPENPLDLDGWRAVVRTMADNAKRSSEWDRATQGVSDEAAEAAAQALADGFPAALRNVVTEYGPESPAFAKLVLLMLGETLALVRASQAAPAGLAGEVEAAREEFRVGLAETVRAEVQPVLEAVEQSSEEILREIAELRRIIVKGFAAQQLDQAGAAEALDTTAAPPPTDVLTGRDAVVAGLVADLGDGVRPNLTGMGGIGKTEVARAVAKAVESQAPAWAAEGVWYVDLSGATSVEGLMQRILAEWPIKLDHPSGATIGRALDAPRLYVLDDVEQALVPDTVRVRAFLRDLLQYAPSARFLVTSRRFVTNVGLTERTITHLDPDDARTLFDRLADVAGYAFADGDEARCDALLSDLDGVPLAITLAAGLLGDYDLAGVLRRWETRRTAALKAVDGDASRLDSLDVSLGMSVEALPDGGAVRALFALFPLVPAGATLAMLEAVFGDDGEDAAVVLRRRGLVQKTDGRFTMRVPVRAYAEAHTTPEADRVEALDDFLLALAKEADARLVEDTARVHALLTLELPTFDAALARARAGRVADLIGALQRWLVYAMPVGVSARLDAGLTASDEIGATLGAANCTQALGDVHRMLGEYGPARARYEQALAAFDEIGATLGAANCTQALGDVHRMLGEYGPARARYEQALAAFDEIGATLGAANCTKALGDVHYMLGEVGPARARYEQALAAYDEIGDRLGAANCTKALGDVHYMLGEYGPARARYEQALAAFDEIGDRLGAANCTKALGDVHRMLGEYGPARTRYEQALAAFEALGSPYGRMQVLLEVGKLERAEGDSAAACAAWAEVQRIAVGLGMGEHPVIVNARGWMAELGC